VFGYLSARGRSWFLFVVASLLRTDTYPPDKRAGYLGGTDLITALRIYGTTTELPLLAGQLVTTLGRSGDLRVDHPYLAAVHARIERVSGNWLRVENISTDRKNPIIFEHREVAECYIKSGNQFRIGDTIYYALNEEMRLSRRTVTEIFGETRNTEIDDCLIAAAVEADRHIVLIGEPGADQARLGREIHRASTRRHNRFIEAPPTRIPGSADLQSIRDARDGTLLIWLPERGKYDQTFISCAMEPHAKVRLIICAQSPGKVDGSFPPSVTDGAVRFNLAPLRTRKDEIAGLLDRWFVERRSSLRFQALAPKIQNRLLSYRWPRNLQELQIAADHLTMLTAYRSEREAERDNSTTRSESRAWRKRLKLPLPLVPDASGSGAGIGKKTK
jgi:hypothetical protein